MFLAEGAEEPNFLKHREERMKVAVAAVILLLSVGVHDSSWAGSGKSSRTGRAGYGQKDPILRDRCDIYDRGGRMRGYTERDP